MKKKLVAAWDAARAPIYTVIVATALAAWGVVHVNGFPKTHLDWTVVGWAALAAGIGAAAKYVDPVIATLAKKAGTTTLGGVGLVPQSQIEAIVQAQLAKAQADAAAKAEPVPPASPLTVA